jgi:hypothetical protein
MDPDLKPSQPTFIKAYTFADFFDRLFRILPQTWKTSIFGGLALLSGPALLIALLMPRGLSGMALAIEETSGFVGADTTNAVWSLLRWNLLFLLVGVAMLILNKLATLAVAHRTRDAAFGKETTWTECLAGALRNSLWPTILQTLLKALMIIAVVTVPTLLVVLASFVGGGGAAPLAIGMALVYIGVVVASLWIFYSLLFSDYAIVFDHTGVIPGLRKSGQLIKGNWWRVFGITLLLTIALSFATGLITTPIAGASMLPSIGRMLEAGMEGSFTDQEMINLLSNAGGIGIGIAISTIIQQLAVLLFMPVFYSLFYIDLKVRAGELGPEEPGAQ